MDELLNEGWPDEWCLAGAGGAGRWVVRGQGMGGCGGAWVRARVFSWKGGVGCTRLGRFSGKRAFSFYCTRWHNGPGDSSEQIGEVITHVWSLVEEVRLQEARTIMERLVENLHIQITANNPEHLLSLAHAYHTAGYVVSEATRAHESYEALFYYKEMESVARVLNNDSLLAYEAR